MIATNLIASTPQEKTYSLEVRRLIRASRERVFRAWTDPADLRKWHAPKGLRPEELAVDVREGGTFEVHMIREAVPAGECYPELSIESGTYETVIPNELLVFTSRGDWNPGELTRVRVEFYDAPEGTEIVIKQTLFLTAGSRDGHSFGWTGSLDKLETIIT